MKIETKRPIIKKKKVSGESIVKMKTEITELLGIEYPIIQGGMAWVAEYHLAAAVSEAGGLGIIGAASAPPEWVRDQIQKAKKMTDKPFGVNIMLMSPYADEIAKVIVEEKVKVVTTGAGSPEKYMQMWKEADVKVIPVVASVALAKTNGTLSCRCGCRRRNGSRRAYRRGINNDSCTASCRCGKDSCHCGRRNRQTEEGLRQHLCSEQKEFRWEPAFIVTEECQVHENYKNEIIRARDIDSKVTGRSCGHPVRTLRNQMTKLYLQKEKEGASFEELEALTLGGLKKAVVEGDVKNGSLMAGQIGRTCHREDDM